MPRKRKEIQYNCEMFICLEDGSEIKWEEATEEQRRNVIQKANDATNKSILTILNRFPYEVRKNYFYAIMRIVVENNLKGIFKYFDAIEILGRKIETDDPDLDKYLFQPIEGVSVTEIKEKIKYSYHPNK